MLYTTGIINLWPKAGKLWTPGSYGQCCHNIGVSLLESKLVKLGCQRAKKNVYRGHDILSTQTMHYKGISQKLPYIFAVFEPPRKWILQCFLLYCWDTAGTKCQHSKSKSPHFRAAKKDAGASYVDVFFRRR